MTTAGLYSRLSADSPWSFAMTGGLCPFEFEALSALVEYLRIPLRHAGSGRSVWRWVENYGVHGRRLVANHFVDSPRPLLDVHERLAERGVAHVAWPAIGGAESFCVLTDVVTNTEDALRGALRELAALADLPPDRRLIEGFSWIQWPRAPIEGPVPLLEALDAGDWLPGRRPH